MAIPCKICSHPRRIEIEKACLTKKSGKPQLAAAQKIDPTLNYDQTYGHFRKHQMTVEATQTLNKKFSALEALDDILARGVGKAVPRASDVVAASRAKYAMELEERRINEFKKFIYAYAADPDGVVRDPRYAHLFPKEFKPGKIEKIPGEAEKPDATTDGTDKKDPEGKE